MYLLYFILILMLCSTAYASWSFITWVPTRTDDLPRILSLAGLRPADTAYDLGCGDGRVAAYLAGHTEARIIGLEISLPFYLISKLRQFFCRRPNLAIRFENLFRADLTGATVIYVFGIPDRLADKLRPKLERELSPGAKVISYAFPIAGWQPLLISRPRPDAVQIFVYQL